MNVVSLFDGMSCLQIALKELNIEVENYYASEVDTHAIKQTQLNFPGTKQLGDVTKWREWDIDWSKVNLIGAGSPCQGFSFAGKQLAFDDPRSKLFFEFALILNHAKKHNPDVKFLLENVNMKREYMRIISEYVGIFPVNINSNLVSAQNRDRWYWSNIRTEKQGLFGDLYTGIPQPKDEGILLKDILESDVDEKYYISQAVIDRMNRKEYSQPQINPDKTGSLNTKNNSGSMSLDSGTTFIQTGVLNNYGEIVETERANCIDSNYWKGVDNHAQRSMVCVAMRGRNPENPSDRRTGSPTQQRLEPKTDGKTNCLTSVAKDNLIMQINPSTESGGKQTYQQNRIYDENGIMPAVMTENRGYVMTENYLQITGTNFDSDNRFWKEDGKHAACITRGSDKTGVITKSRIRRLTPTEVSRLQTIPDWYIWQCSDTQIYRMCGNGWTVDVIVWILSFLVKSHVMQLENVV